MVRYAAICTKDGIYSYLSRSPDQGAHACRRRRVSRFAHPTYHRRQPQRTVLYRAVQSHRLPGSNWRRMNRAVRRRLMSNGNFAATSNAAFSPTDYGPPVQGLKAERHASVPSPSSTALVHCSIRMCIFTAWWLTGYLSPPRGGQLPVRFHEMPALDAQQLADIQCNICRRLLRVLILEPQVAEHYYWRASKKRSRWSARSAPCGSSPSSTNVR